MSPWISAVERQHNNALLRECQARLDELEARQRDKDRQVLVTVDVQPSYVERDSIAHHLIVQFAFDGSGS